MNSYGISLGNTLFGIPLVFWGFGCLAVAVAYYRLWPQPSPKRTQPRTRFQHLTLRYGHALVWLLLAGGCFLAGASQVTIGLTLAFASLPVYIAFLVVLLQDRQRELADLAAQRKAKPSA
jgi:hypothetical protein